MTTAFVTFLLVLMICQASSLIRNTDKVQVDLKYRLPAGVVTPTSYKLHITPNFEKFTFEGEVDIKLTALTNNDNLTLNSKELKIKSVELMDLNTTKTFKNSYLTDEMHEIMIINLHSSLEKDHHYSLKINYSGILNERMKGFYLSRIIEDDEVTGYVAVTHFQPTDARSAFPCWDEPIYKAKFTISLVHNKTLQAISNMGVQAKQEGGGDMVTTSFKETPPMSTYLVAFIIGDYVRTEDKTDDGFVYGIWTERSAMNHTRYALKKMRQILEELNVYTGIPYQNYMPEKIDQVSLKDFTAGAMENWGLVTYRESALLHDEAKTTATEKKFILTVMAHELCHQWFGNLVTPIWWKHIWLNEGFGNYFQYFIPHKVEPELRLDHMFVVENMQGMAMVADAHPKTTKMIEDANTPKEIDALFNNIAYNKASSVIRMMSHALTEAVFHRGLQIYLTKHALGNADSNNLGESLQRALNEKPRWTQPKCREPVKEVMQEWLERPGYPMVTVKRVEEGYQLTQEHFVMAMIKIDEFNTKWWIPTTYVEESDPNFNNTYPADWIDPSEESHIVHSKQKEGWFIFNTQQAGYYRVNYDEKNWKLLTNELNMGSATKIHVLNRAQLIDDAMNIAQIKRLNYTIALDLTLYLRHETDYIPWVTAFRHVHFLQNVLRTSNKYYLYKRYVAYLMRGLTEHVGYEPKAGESELIKIFREQAFPWACEFGVKSCISYAEKQYHHWLENPKGQLDPGLMNEILCAGVRNANVNVWHKTKELLIASTNDAEERKERMLILTCSNSPIILIEFLKSTFDKNSPIDFLTAVQHVVGSYPRGPQLVYNFLIKEYRELEKLENFHDMIPMVALAIGGGITDMQLYLNLSAFLMDRKLGNALQQALGGSTENMIWIHDHRSTVEKWLDANSHLFDNSASSIAIASFLLIFSLFITRFY